MTKNGKIMVPGKFPGILKIKNFDWRRFKIFDCGWPLLGRWGRKISFFTPEIIRKQERRPLTSFEVELRYTSNL